MKYLTAKNTGLDVARSLLNGFVSAGGRCKIMHVDKPSPNIYTLQIAIIRNVPFKKDYAADIKTMFSNGGTISEIADFLQMSQSMVWGSLQK